MSDDWKVWLTQVMIHRPKNNAYLNSKRGIEVAALMLDIERDLFSWRRSDIDTFWIDVQLAVKYKLTDEEIEFICRMQPGTTNYSENAAERHAYAEMMRGVEKLRMKIAEENADENGIK